MSIKSLPSMEHVFTVDIKGSETGQQFQGTFKYKRPNIRIQSEIAKTSAMLDGGLSNIDKDTKFLHSVLATLQHTLIDVPEWWQKADSGYELYDHNVIFDIYTHCNKFEKKWFDEVWADKKEKKKKDA